MFYKLMAPTQSSVITLAHVSDVHLPPPRLLPPWRHLMNKRGLSVLSWRKNRVFKHLEHLSATVIEDIKRDQPDLILNTGDLTNFGLPQEYEYGAAWLSNLPAKSLVVPGNHDALMAEDWTTTGALWAAWMQNAQVSSFPYCYKHGDIAIIGMNSAIPTPPFISAGYVGKAQRDRLTTLLEQTAGMFRLVMIHHPPRRGLVSWRKSLRDDKAVSDILVGAGVELVVHGHSHNATVTILAGSDIPLVGSASASLKSSAALRQAGWNRFKVLRQTDGWQVILERRSYNEEKGWQTWPAQRWDVKSRAF